VKTTLSAVALVVALSLSAVAANSKKPVVSQHKAGSGTPFQEIKDLPNSMPPALCSPCLFYAGDINTGDINAAGMSDENTLLIVGGGSTYGAVNVSQWSNRLGLRHSVQRASRRRLRSHDGQL